MPLVNIGQPYKRKQRNDAVRPVAGDVQVMGSPVPWQRADGSERVLLHMSAPEDVTDWAEASMARLLRRAEWVNNVATLGVAWALRRRRR